MLRQIKLLIWNALFNIFVFFQLFLFEVGFYPFLHSKSAFFNRLFAVSNSHVRFIFEFATHFWILMSQFIFVINHNFQISFGGKKSGFMSASAILMIHLMNLHVKMFDTYQNVVNNSRHKCLNHLFTMWILWHAIYDMDSLTCHLRHEFHNKTSLSQKR